MQTFHTTGTGNPSVFQSAAPAPVRPWDSDSQMHEMQSINVQVKPGGEEINPTLKKMGIAILALQVVLFILLLVITVVAVNTQGRAAELQNRLAERLPIIEGILDNYATAARFLHSSLPDVTKRMLTSDKMAAMKSVNVLADKVYSAFNDNSLSGSTDVARIASMVRSMTSGNGLQKVQDVCPAGGSLCPTPTATAKDTLDSDIMAIPSYFVSFLAKQANVTEWRMAGRACSLLFNNMQTANLAGTYSWGPRASPQTDSWNFNDAKSTFSDIAKWCDSVAALPV
jgi:hypothetical protein